MSPPDSTSRSEPTRCAWPGRDPLYLAYHDEEWGAPERDDRALFEKLVLDGFQAGLAWITILRKREGFRRVFEGFYPQRIARWGEADVLRALADPSIVRSRAKIEGAVRNARAYLALEAELGSFSDYLWGFVGNAPRINPWSAPPPAPAETALSRELSRDLKARGFVFCGPVITYAFMQAVGLVQDHAPECFRYQELGGIKRP